MCVEPLATSRSDWQHQGGLTRGETLGHQEGTFLCNFNQFKTALFRTTFLTQSFLFCLFSCVLSWTSWWNSRKSWCFFLYVPGCFHPPALATDSRLILRKAHLDGCVLCCFYGCQMFFLAVLMLLAEMHADQQHLHRFPHTLMNLHVSVLCCKIQTGRWCF